MEAGGRPGKRRRVATPITKETHAKASDLLEMMLKSVKVRDLARALASLSHHSSAELDHQLAIDQHIPPFWSLPAPTTQTRVGRGQRRGGGAGRGHIDAVLPERFFQRQHFPGVGWFGRCR